MVCEGSLEALIRRHLERRPQMRAVDVYKLLYQGVFGVRHLFKKETRRRLEAEARTLRLDEHPEEPLIEEASADSSMVRVNLRPYLRRGLPLSRLFTAMELSAWEKGRVEEFLKAWGLFKELVSSGRLIFDNEEIEELDRDLEIEGCQPRHHSEAYRRAYAPAYRVVKREVLERMFNAEELGDSI
jgi:hypothetical protein